MDPLVSVIIPTYNRAAFVAKAVESVLNQTYKRMEIIVVDDGSTDNTYEALKRYEGRIRYIYQQRSERSRARNRGFRHSRGDYIAFLDSDDLWLPTKIKRQVRIFLEEPEVGIVYTDIEFIDKNGSPYGGNICWEALKRRRASLYEDLMSENVISGSTSSVLIRRECLEKVGLFDETMSACEDLDLWRRLAQHFQFSKIDMQLVRLTVHVDNTQCQLSAMAKGYETIIRKICESTPPEHKYYRNEAIIRLLSRIANSYRCDGRLHLFFLFCVKAIFQQPNWIAKPYFWLDFLRLSLKRLSVAYK